MSQSLELPLIPYPSLQLLVRSLFSARGCLHAVLGFADVCTSKPAGKMRLSASLFWHHQDPHTLCGPVNSRQLFQGYSLHGNSFVWSPIQPGMLQFPSIKADWDNRLLRRGAMVCFSQHLAVSSVLLCQRICETVCLRSIAAYIERRFSP